MRGQIVVAVALMVAGCDDEPPPSRPSVLETGTPPSFTSARRPAQTVYLERQDAGCAVYWQADGTTSEKRTVLCPRDLEVGERMRLSGRTCHRESSVKAREVPVRCAQPLLSVQQAIRDGEGELLLKPAK